MTTPLHLTDDETDTWNFAAVNRGVLASELEQEHGAAVHRALQKLSDARAAKIEARDMLILSTEVLTRLWEWATTIACRSDIGNRYITLAAGVIRESRKVLSALALATPAPVALPARGIEQLMHETTSRALKAANMVLREAAPDPVHSQSRREDAQEPVKETTMAKQTKTYHDVSPVQLAQIRASLQQHGINFPDLPVGSVPVPHGFTLSWSYGDALDGRPECDDLSITLEGSLFLMSVAWSQVDAFIHPFVSG